MHSTLFQLLFMYLYLSLCLSCIRTACIGTRIGTLEPPPLFMCLSLFALPCSSFSRDLLLSCFLLLASRLLHPNQALKRPAMFCICIFSHIHRIAAPLNRSNKRTREQSPWMVWCVSRQWYLMLRGSLASIRCREILNKLEPLTALAK